MKEASLRVLFDSNIIIDVFTNRDGAEDSIDAMLLLPEGRIVGFLTAKQIGDIHYVLRKYKNDQERLDIVKKLLDLFCILPTDSAVLKQALFLSGCDFEDNIIVSSASVFGIDCILTKNKKHFSSCGMTICSPSELKLLLQKLK